MTAPARPAPWAARAAVLALALLAALPAFGRGLPLGADTVTHLYTLVHVENLWRHGVLWSRWLPWQVGGVGNPRFLFYPYLPYALVEPLVLAGATHGVALLAGFVGALVAAALGAFAWCRLQVRDGAAVVGAAAVVLAPYLLFAAWSRASWAEVMAIGVAPWALWAAERWRRDPSPRRLAASATLAGVAGLCHPISGGLLLPGWLATHLAAVPFRPRRVAAALAALALALGLSAVLWLPARLERAEIGNAHVRSQGLDWRHNFVPAAQLVAPPFVPGLRRGLAPAALVLAAIGVVSAARRRALPVLVAATCSAALVLATTAAARPLWQLFARFADDVQFPHRLLGPAAVFAALPVAFGAAAVARRAATRAPRAATWAIPVLVLLLAPSLLPLRQVGRLRTVPPLDVAFVVRKDREAGMAGFGYKGDFVPRTTPSIAAAWKAARDPWRRLASERLPPGARILSERYTPLRFTVELETPRRRC